MRATAAILALTTALATSACATVQVDYRAKYRTEDGRRGTLRLRQAQEVGAGHRIACGVTWFVYGGWCWAYLAMPFGGQTTEAGEDAAALASRRLGTGVTLRGASVQRVDFDEAQRRLDVTPGRPGPRR